MEDDLALEWLANEVEAPLLAVMKRAFHAYLHQAGKDDVKLIEAEAAAALLVDLTGDHSRMKYTPFSGGFLAYQAKEEGLWSLASEVVTRLLAEEDWLRGWSEPQSKRQALEQLLSGLRHIEAINEDT
jgi:hypothetical protein